MPLYRRKPLIVEAWPNYTGDPKVDGGPGRMVRAPEWLNTAIREGRILHGPSGSLLVKTPHGTIQARLGDWILWDEKTGLSVPGTTFPDLYEPVLDTQQHITVPSGPISASPGLNPPVPESPGPNPPVPEDPYPHRCIGGADTRGEFFEWNCRCGLCPPQMTPEYALEPWGSGCPAAKQADLLRLYQELEARVAHLEKANAALQDALSTR